MKLNPAPFEKIKSGEKIYELRLYDERRKAIRVGDMIEFTKTDGSDKLTAEVIELIVFDSFAELYGSLPLNKCGYDDPDKADPADMEQYYTKEQQKNCGVVAIKIKVIWRTV